MAESCCYEHILRNMLVIPDERKLKNEEFDQSMDDFYYKTYSTCLRQCLSLERNMLYRYQGHKKSR